MGKKPGGKEKGKGKGSQLVIRIEKAEREAFVTLCERLDTSAAREIRRFMRKFVASHETEAASELTDLSLAPEKQEAKAPVASVAAEANAAPVAKSKRTARSDASTG